MRDISTDLLRSLTRSIDVNYISNDEKKEKELILYHKGDLKMYSWYRTDEGKSYKYLEDDIGYVSLGNIKAEDVIFIKQFFNKQKGIIIDIRNYPSTFVPFSLGSYFMTADTPFVKFTQGNVDNPGEFTFGGTIEIPKSDKPYKGKVIVIVNELSQSQAEYTAMAFRAGVNTTIIGSTTAGADGNVSRISLPGGLRTMISGIGVYYPDGTETQRVGIVPDILVKPTIEGIKNGRDELLEKAIELIKESE
jgi:C-terminal processing protease CtpA/Prc